MEKRKMTIAKTLGRVLATALVMASWAASAAYVADGLVLHYDAIDNAGAGSHDPAATVLRP